MARGVVKSREGRARADRRHSHSQILFPQSRIFRGLLAHRAPAAAVAASNVLRNVIRPHCHRETPYGGNSANAWPVSASSKMALLAGLNFPAVSHG